MNTGFARAFDRSMVLPEQMMRKIPVVGEFLGKHGLDEQISHDQGEAAKPNENMSQSVGGGLETIAEFLTGEEALKGLSLGAKLQKIAPVLKTLEKYPRMAKILETGIRQGTVGAAQSAEHGESASEALTTGAITGVTGGAAEAVIPAAYGGVKSLIAKIRPRATVLEGANVPVLASQLPKAAPIAGKIATMATPGTEKMAEAQQEGGRNAIVNIAQRATRNGLEKVNALRQRIAAITDPSRLLEAPEGSKGFEFTIDGPPPQEVVEGGGTAEPRKKQIGTQYVGGKGSGASPTTEAYPEGTFKYGDEAALPAVSDADPFAGKGHKEPVFQYLSSPKGGTAATDVTKGGGQLKFTDPGQAQAYLSHLEDIHDSAQFAEMPKAQQAQITAARDSMQEQLGLYHAQERLNPHFEPVDAAGLAQHVSSFGDAADQLEASVKPIYQKLDEVSGGQFTALRNQSKAAAKVMFQPGSVKAYEEAVTSKAAADSGIQDLFNRYGTEVSRPELQSANAAWRDANVLHTIHATVDGAIKGAPQDIADTLGKNRLIRGNSLETRLNRMLVKTPRADVERVIGYDGLQNLYRVSDLLSKPETALPTRNVAAEIAREMTRRVGKGALVGGVVGHIFGQTAVGALTGAALEDGTRFILRQAAINPRVGMLVDRAVRHQVNPRIFAPLIASAINSEPTQ
jgi:hypothetical protein